MTSLKGKVALVTGASRGIGRGIALELAAAGARVYGTGRKPSAAATSGGAQADGGVTMLQCDHADDEAVNAVFSQIEKQAGQLDILVNNLYPTNLVIDWPGPEVPGGKPFWEVPPEVWTGILDGGVRAHCIATALAAPALLKTKGLVVNISSGGAAIYYATVLYGITKAAIERLTRDAAIEFRPYGVTVLSIWPGMVRTETQEALYASNPEATVGFVKSARLSRKQAWAATGHTGTIAETNLDAETLSIEAAWACMETPAFTGRAVAALAMDGERLKRTGQSLSAVGLAHAYGFTDVNGGRPDAFGYADPGVWPLLSA